MDMNNAPTIRTLVERALMRLYELDYDSMICIRSDSSIEKHTGERSIVFCFGLYFRQELDKYEFFKGYSLDYEYNREGIDPKRRENGCLVIPDMVLHKRGTKEDNLAVFEFKGWWNPNQEDDIKKIREFTNPNGKYKYKEGYPILFDKEIPFIAPI